MEYNWLLIFDEFCKKAKTIRIPEYYDDYYRLGKKHLHGYRYYIYLDENFELINPNKKKDSGKKVAYRFVSTMSREDVLRQSYIFILKEADKLGLFDDSVCEPEIAKRQKLLLLKNI